MHLRSWTSQILSILNFLSHRWKVILNKNTLANTELYHHYLPSVIQHGRLYKPTQRDFNPDVYLLHVGTNDLSSNKSPEQISLDILNLANSLKLDNNTVIVSSIVPRDDEN